MKLNRFVYLFLSFSCFIGYSQNKKESILNNAYVSGEIIYRSYGIDDIIGFGAGAEISKDLKKWLGLGVNLSYWDNNKLNWDFRNPFTGERYQYYGRIKEFKVSPFVQLIPLNTKYFDFIVHTGVRTGYYHQNHYSGGYSTGYDPDVFEVFIYDEGFKGFTIGYELGLALRFQIGKLIIVPSSIFSNDTNGNAFNSLNLKVGWQL